MNNSRTKRLPKILIGQSLVGILIISVALYLVLYALGYKINLTTRKIIKTGLIVLSINPKPDQISVNGDEIAAKDDVSLSLEPGFYDIVVKKNGYQDWTIRSQVNAELVNYFKYIELFKTEPELSELTDRDAIDILNSASAALAVNAPKGLKNSDYEIWLDEKLVTRFSAPISQVSWYPDNHHIVYQRADEIRIIDEAGNNDKLLVKLPSSAESKFVFANKGQDIYISHEGKYYSAEIQ